MNAELITIVANISLTLSLIAAIIFGLAQARAAARDRKERLTLDTLGKFQTQEFTRLMHYVVWHKFPPTQKSLNLLPVEEQVNLIQFAQIMESLGLLVAEKLIDIGLVDKTLGTLVTSSWKKYEPMFRDVRVNQPDPFLGEYFQWLAERLEEEMRKNPRKPAFEA